MQAVGQQAKQTVHQLRTLGIAGLYATLRERLYSTRIGYGSRRDLNVPFEAPPAAIPLTVRPLTERDVSVLLDVTAPGLDDDGRHERRVRLGIVNEGFSTCYVAVTDQDEPCYMQWLIGPTENDHVQSFWDGIYPTLAPDEALLEGAFTPERYRGQRIMPCAMAQIAERGAEIGARYILTFTDVSNVGSQKGTKRAGFAMAFRRKETWRFFRHRVTFTPLPKGTPYPFDAEPTTT